MAGESAPLRGAGNAMLYIGSTGLVAISGNAVLNENRDADNVFPFWEIKYFGDLKSFSSGIVPAMSKQSATVATASLPAHFES